MPAPPRLPAFPCAAASVLQASPDDSRRAELCGVIHLSGVRRDVADHGVRVAAFGVEVGVGVVFGDAP